MPSSYYFFIFFVKFFIKIRTMRTNPPKNIRLVFFCNLEVSVARIRFVFSDLKRACEFQNLIIQVPSSRFRYIHTQTKIEIGFRHGRVII
jgi:hypothetical protein